MKHRPSLRDLIVRHKMRINIGALIAFGLWAAWIAWITRPGDIDVPAVSTVPCVRCVR